MFAASICLAPLAFSASLRGGAGKNWNLAKAKAHDDLIALLMDQLINGPRRLQPSAVFVEQAVHELPRECGLPWAAEGIGLLTPDIVALDAEAGELLIIEVTICPDAALGKYIGRKRQKYLPLCRNLAFYRTPQMVVAPPLVVAVGTSGRIPESSRDAVGVLLAAPHEVRFGGGGAATNDGVLLQRDLVLDEAVAIARSRPDAPPLARVASAAKGVGARRGATTRRRRRAAAEEQQQQQ